MHRYQNAIDTLNNGGTVAIIGRDLTHAHGIMMCLHTCVTEPPLRTNAWGSEHANGAYIALASPRSLDRLAGLITDHVISIRDPKVTSIADHLTAIRNIPADTGNTWIAP